jgi:hypothetical protein
MILTGKFFEYLATGRPILCIGPTDGDAAEILRATNAGLVSEHGDIPTLEKHILDYYQRYRNGSLTADSRNIDLYSRKKLTGQLAHVLDCMTTHQSR